MSALDAESTSVLRGIVFLISLVVVAYSARRAFDTPIATPEGGPAAPRYMTQPRQYRLGMITYIGLCLASYALIIGYYQDLIPFVHRWAPSEFREFITVHGNDSPMSFLTVVIFGSMALITLLNIEHEWNPFYILRRIVLQWTSIPALANQIMVASVLSSWLSREMSGKV